MKNYYYELKITPSAFFEEIENFLMERFFNGIEEKNKSLILRGEEDFSDLIKELIRYKNALEKLFDTHIDLDIKVEKKSNEDWIEKYKSSINPIEVEDFYIHPSWYEDKDGKINIIIDPALAFGSGHHETTKSCIKALKRVVKQDNTLVDVGCGSGILGIVANKLGAKVDACDTDEVAIKSTIENFKLNNAILNDIWQGSINNTTKSYDIVVANIIADVLIFLSKELKERVNNYLILSGIIDKYKNRVLEKFSDLELVEEIKENEWVTLILKKGS